MKKPFIKVKESIRVILHILQQAAIVAGVLLLIYGISASNLWVKADDGTLRVFTVDQSEKGIDFEKSDIFRKILTEKVMDVICFGAIRGQLETDGQYDGYKEIDVTAYANRHIGTPREYITARYYLQDLLKWSQYGFEYNYDVVLPDDFLNDISKVTRINISSDQKKNDMITDTYLNSDIKSSVYDVSGNQLQYLDGAVTEFNGEIYIDRMLVNLYQTVEDKVVEDYVSTLNEYYDLCVNVENAANELLINTNLYQQYGDLFIPNNTNIRYCIKKNLDGRSEVYTNLNLPGDMPLQEIDKAFHAACDKYIFYNAATKEYDTNTSVKEEDILYAMNGYQYAYPQKTMVWIGVDTDYPWNDIFQNSNTEYSGHTVPFMNWFYVAIPCFLIYLLLMAVLTKMTGEVVDTEGNRHIQLRKQDKIPTEIMLLMAVAVFAGIFLAVVRFREEISLYLNSIIIIDIIKSNWFLPLVGVAALLCSLIFSCFYYGFVRKIKARRLWKDSLIRMLAKRMRRMAVYAYDNASVVLRVWPLIICLAMIHVILLLIVSVLYSDSGKLVVHLLMITIDIILGVFFYLSAKAREDIVGGIKKIRDGDLEHKVSEKNLHGDNLILAQAVNSIGDGIRTAVETSMKDERMRADLVTNVSHDIKTPLTSIINYINLIKREDIDNEQVKEYVEILDSKSQRLKQLTDDLVEASKISSGNISLNWEAINLIELVNQTIGEFSEKFEQRKLDIKVNTVGTKLLINADSRRMWRVIENLFNNVCKYALTGTRVYIDIMAVAGSKGQVALAIKNISEQPLNISADELTERFIRGDVSRSTEGSGLGLSIAKSLTEVQKGSFRIDMDGDLFKVVLTFPVLEK